MSEVLLERSDRVGVITVHDPERRNALTLDLSDQLVAAVKTCEQDADVHAVVVTGAPPAFCAGADLTALGEAREQGLRRIYAGFLAVADCALPTIAAVGGAAVGAGLNLALACDVRLAGPKARFDARFLQLGIHPGGGMTWLLQRLVGPQAATAMTLFGQVLDADAAVRHGLAWDRVDGGHDELVASAVEFARASAEAPRDLVRTIKATMRTTAVLDAHADAVDTEVVPQVASIETPEFAARLAAMKARISGRP
ncbi:enoyl-CoA hydratase [Actinosynnema sp. NPDC047251]|uniref:Putative enoyl-CoA hydratase n=1 Tax=Saccharothrix espanaensis (strain ATCC 51144 / DSM 44229 / JCM 9112 / NBRC 15066 / NRRL 15764) TaxID=1179773 RepID=K0KFD7_SACES|nr:enoyl-CoA hydratase [Saccharothrix espanaensis]CCH35233.1 putative enoyl-CoA hydratase [Saccharothrix espanaensis DSM 44229]